MKLPTDLNDTKGLRDFFTMVRQQACALVDCLSEPWKTHFTALKGQFDEALKALPPTDQVPAALDANRNLSAFFSCLCSAMSLNSVLGADVQRLSQANATAVTTALNSALPAEITKRITAGELFDKAGIDAAVAAAIEAQTKTGDLVPKDTVTQLCSAATDKGLADGEKKVRDEQAAASLRTAKIGERKTVLQTAGLPLPEAAIEGILAGTDDEFKAVQTTAEARIAALNKKGIALNAKSPLAAKVYLPADQWTVFESLAVETLSSADPLKAPPARAAEGKPGLFIC